MNARMMLSSARPILWETGDESFPYRFGGTCFLAEYEGRLYVITAGHCIKDDPNRLFVERYPGAQYPLPICYIRYMRPENPSTADDTDFSDVAIVTINKDKLDLEDVDRLMSVDLTKPLMGEELSDFSNSKLLVRGFPNELGRYEDDELGRGALFASGTYHGQSHSWGMHTMILDEPSIIKSYNGLSGSPICLAFGNNFSAAQFVGVVIKGGNSFLHFIDARIVRAFLRIINNPPERLIRENGVIEITGGEVELAMQTGLQEAVPLFERSRRSG